MTDFDPYYVWLGIPPKNQPPDHYRLLGLEAFEPDLRVIESAADRQMAHVKTFQTGKNGPDSQRILTHLSQARQCLLNPQQKAAYDAALRQQYSMPPPGVAAAPMAIPMAYHGAAPYGTPFSPMAAGYPPPQPQFPMAIPAPMAPSAPLGGPLGFDVPFPTMAPSPPQPTQTKSDVTIVAASIVGAVVVIGILSLVLWNTWGAASDRQVTKPSHVADNSSSQGLPTSGQGTENSTAGSSEPEPTVPTAPPSSDDQALSNSPTTEAPTLPPPSKFAPLPTEPLVPSGPPVSVLKSITGPLLQTGGAGVGNWQMTNGELHGVNGGVLLPGRLPADYQLDLKVSHIADGAFLVMGFPIADRPACLVLNWNAGGTFVSGLHYLDSYGTNQNENESTHKGQVFQSSKPSHVRCVVRGNFLQVTIDEQTIIQWRGDPTRITMSPHWRHIGEDALCIALGGGEARISSIEITPLEPIAVLPRPDPPFVLAPPRKFEAPSKKELQQATTAVKKGYDKEFNAAKTPRAKRELAKTLFDRAQDDKDPLSLRFGFWTEAQSLAAANLDANLACKAIDEIAKYFEIDTLSERAGTLEAIAQEIAPSTPLAELRNVAEASLVTLDEAIAAERFDLAKRLEVILKALSLHKRLFERRAFIAKRLAATELACELFEAAQAKNNGSSPEGNFAAGRYECFVQGNWSKGLPLLAAGSDEALAAVAKLELDIVENGDDAKYAQLGDAWWGLSQTAGAQWDAEYQRQARYWYEHATNPLLVAQFRDRIKDVRGVARNRYQPGLVGTYYGYNENGILRMARIDKNIARPWLNGSPDPSIGPDDFTVVWRGTIQAPMPGKYVISVNSDDGSRVLLDGAKLWDDLGGGSGTRGAEVDLTGEPQQIEVSCHEATVNAHCFLLGRFADEPADRIVDGRFLRHDPVVARKFHATEYVGNYSETVRVPSVPEGGLLALFEDQKELPAVLTEDTAPIELDYLDRYSGEASVRVGNVQRFGTDSMGVRAKIRENPGPGEYRFVRFAWKKIGGGEIAIQFHGLYLKGDRDWRRYHTGSNKDEFPWGGKSYGLADEGPSEWTVVTRDLFADYGEFDLTGLALTAFDRGYAKFDHIYLARMKHDFDKLGELAAAQSATEETESPEEKSSQEK